MKLRWLLDNVPAVQEAVKEGRYCHSHTSAIRVYLL
jgi:hypothetical protein